MLTCFEICFDYIYSLKALMIFAIIDSIWQLFFGIFFIFIYAKSEAAPLFIIISSYSFLMIFNDLIFLAKGVYDKNPRLIYIWMYFAMFYIIIGYASAIGLTINVRFTHGRTSLTIPAIA